MRSRCQIWFSTTDSAAQEEFLMKEEYIVPEIEISVIDDRDIVMASGLVYEDSGTLPSIPWSDIA